MFRCPECNSENITELFDSVMRCLECGYCDVQEEFRGKVQKNKRKERIREREWDDEGY